jgi:MFS family permease
VDSSGVLGNRRFLVLWTGNGLSLLGNSGVRVAYPLIVLAITGSPAWAGWVTLAGSLPALLFQVPAGVLADAVNRRQIMIVCQVLGLLATGAAALAIVSRAPGLLPLLLVTAFLEGTAFVLFGVAEVAAIRDVTDESQRAAAFSFYEAEQPVAHLVGRALGGALYGLGRWLPFAANAVSYAVCLVTLSRVPRTVFAPRRAPAPDAPAESFWFRMGDGLRLTWRVPFLRRSTFATGASNMVFQGVILLVIVVSSDQGRPAWTIGLILAAAGVGGVGGSFAAVRLDRRVRPEVLFAAYLWGCTAMVLLIALSRNPFVLASAWCGIGAIGTINAVALTMARVRAVSDAALGRIVGAASVITVGAVPLGAVLAGYLLATWDAQSSGWILVAAMVLVALAGSRVLAPAGSGR